MAKHFDIPETERYQLPVIAEGKGSYKFKDATTVSLKINDGKLSIIDSWGYGAFVPSTDKDIQITDVECFIVM